ncbi:flagellin [Desulfofundulus sp. TPOSR]|uniref:flagellin N-terminal helical domain-containing protein n=1 Tax=Desulfofundulus sp. TPOSR TaxID=2714340 RepID=UPI00140D1F67|nr:flagellin [Desulfofundulus sp. TPOSR]NHM28183.1 flagellin [Desulfofundulus sp. TPOSR]
MIINHNIAALNTYRQLSVNNSLAAKSLEKLSSGLRINRAADDAAGLAISEKMRGQIRGLDKAARNAQDAISLIQTAEGALNETHSILQRMRELAVQAASDTNTESDRAAIQAEINQLKNELTRIADTTEFNTKKLLNGQLARAVTVSGASGDLAGAGVKIDVNPGSQDVGSYTLTVSQYASKAYLGDAGAFVATGVSSDGAIVINGVTINIAQGDTIDVVKDKINAFSSRTGVTAATGGTNGGIQLISSQKGSDQTIQVSGVKNLLKDLGITTDTGTDIGVYSAAGTDAVATLTPQGGGSAINLKAVGNTLSYSVTGLKIDFDVAKEGAPTDSNPDTATIIISPGGQILFHIGANKDQNVALSLDKMDAQSLGVQNIDLTTQTGANNALTTIDNAIAQVSSVRGNLGALQNRLEHTISNLDVAKENITAAESRIRDIDMAKEMMEYTKLSILQQAATAMLSQANQQPQQVLQLLR